MKPGSRVRRLITIGVAAVLLAGAAPAADVRVMISAGYFAAYSELGPAFERATGHRLVTTRGPSLGDSPEAIPTRLARGDRRCPDPGWRRSRRACQTRIGAL